MDWRQARPRNFLQECACRCTKESSHILWNVEPRVYAVPSERFARKTTISTDAGARIPGSVAFQAMAEAAHRREIVRIGRRGGVMHV